MYYFQQAYTFFEAILAIAIMAILAAIAIPSWRHVIDHHNDSILQSQLLQTIQLARQEAYIRGMPIVICKSKSKTACGGEWADGAIIFIDEQDNGTVQDRKYILSASQYNTHHGKINWRAYPYYREYLRFVPTLGSSADNGMFWYCRPRHDLPAFAIVLNRAGSGRIVYPNADGKIIDSKGRVMRC